MPLPLLGLLVIVLALPAVLYVLGRRRLARTPAQCASCGSELAATDRLLGRLECPPHRAASIAERDQARARYLGALTAFDFGTSLTPSAERILTETTLESVGTRWHERVAMSAIAYLLEQALADDILTREEDTRITSLAGLARVTVPDVLRVEPRLAPHVVTARVNDGRLPIVQSPTIRLRRREICFFEAPAGLMSDADGAAVVTNRGVPTVKGGHVDYGRLVGTLFLMNPDLRPWDDGTLVITDQRVFFEGHHLSIQIPHRRLIGFTLFKDGLQVRIADRRTEPIFRVADPLVVAAIAGGASLKTSNEPLPRAHAVESFADWPVIPAGSA